jgi:DNA (cytosine-5)-methyltransferase 1
LGNAVSAGLEGRQGQPGNDGQERTTSERTGGLEHAALSETERFGQQQEHISGTANFWSDSYWLQCTDGKARRVPVESGIQPLASGISNRVVKLRGSGNAIVPPLAATFIEAVMDLDIWK